MKAVYTINFPAIAPSAAHNFSVKTIEFKMAAVSVKRSIDSFPSWENQNYFLGPCDFMFLRVSTHIHLDSLILDNETDAFFNVDSTDTVT